jgi:hypothetical protein
MSTGRMPGRAPNTFRMYQWHKLKASGTERTRFVSLS